LGAYYAPSTAFSAETLAAVALSQAYWEDLNSASRADIWSRAEVKAATTEYKE
jgi:hypothetical protein